MTIGLFGGTFDPIHIGHLLMAQEVASKLGLAKVIFIPAQVPPMKNIQTSAEHRYQMVQLAIKDNPFFEISDLELRRKKISYTASTITTMKKEYQEPLTFIIGSDNLSNFTKWHRWKFILENCDLGVGERPGYGKKSIECLEGQVTPKIYQKIQKNFVSIPLINISSTEIRRRNSKKESIRYFVPLQVENYIKKHQLYQSNPATTYQRKQT